MMRFFWRSALTVALLGVCFSACGDDDPAAVDTPCNDANTACTKFNLGENMIDYESSYDDIADQTSHFWLWDVGSAEVTGYGPGRLIVTLDFNPPLEVRFDHSNLEFFLNAGAGPGCFDRFASLTPSVSSEWATINTSAGCSGECVTGASRLSFSLAFGPLTTGMKLSSLVFDVSIPENYTLGSAAGEPVLAGDLGIDLLGFEIDEIPGNSLGNPPVWQGTFEPTQAQK